MAGDKAYTGLIIAGPCAGQIHTSDFAILTVETAVRFKPAEQDQDGNFHVSIRNKTFNYVFTPFAGRGFWVPFDQKEDRMIWILDQLMYNYRPRFDTGYKG